MLPPIWQEPSAPRLSGNSRSARSAALWISFRTTPASTVMVSLTVSIVADALQARGGDDHLAHVVRAAGAAPVSPVLPPCGTMAMPASAQMRTMPATSSVDWGLSTSGNAALPNRRASSCSRARCRRDRRDSRRARPRPSTARWPRRRPGRARCTHLSSSRMLRAMPNRARP